MPKRIILLTGTPGVGKTTVLTKAVNIIAMDRAVGGMISREVREGGIRVGFEIVSLTDGKRGWLAHVNLKSGPRLGKYYVNIADLENVGVKAILQALETCEFIAIDEVGPMELFSQKFKQAVRQVFNSQKQVLAVVHAKARDSLISEAKQRADAEVFEVNLTNRGSLPLELATHVLQNI